MKVLASDLDGTLYFGEEENKIKPQDVAAIKQFQKEGNLFGICSGRTLVGIHNALDGLDVKLDFYILVSGSQLAKGDETFIYRHLISRDILVQIFEKLQGIHTSLLACASGCYYRMIERFIPDNHSTLIQDINEIKDEEFDSIHLAFKDEEELLKAQDILNTISNIEVHRNVLNLDIAPKGCSKGNAIKTFHEYFDGISYEDVAVIGDSFNDISMFEAAKTSFSFHRSEDIVKDKATYLVEDIAEAIKELTQHD